MVKTLPRSALTALVALVLCQAAAAQGREGFAADAPRVLVIPPQETTLVAPVAATVTDIATGLGTAFNAGETLVRFDCSVPVARRKIAEAEVAGAEQNLQAKRRLEALSAAGEVEVALAAAALDKARAELGLAEVFVSQCRVRAPFAGRLVKQHVRRHQGVKSGDPLLDLVASGSPRLRLNVPSRWLAWLQVGTVFETLVDESGKVYRARVQAVNARVDAVSQSIEIEAEVIGEHAELLAGMSGVARFSPPR